MKKQYILALMTLLLTMALIGCGKKSVKESIPDTTPIITQEPQDQVTATTIPEKEDEPALIPFSTSPEDDIQIAYMDDIIKNHDKYAEMYHFYAVARLTGGIAKEFDDFLDEMNGEEQARFAANGDKYILIKSKLTDEVKVGIEELVANMIQNYLKYTRLGNKDIEITDFTKEMAKADPVGKVNNYMSKNDIVVTDIVFPGTVESSDFDIFPMKFTYRYVIKGTNKGKDFEKEVAQDFYLGAEIAEDGKSKDVIEYIKDTPEE